MRLEDCLELKSETLRSLEPPFRTFRDALPSFHVERPTFSGPRLEVDLPSPAGLRHRALRRPPVALGVARGSEENDYRLAVRVQDVRLLESDVVDEIRERARGEVDIRYIGEGRPLASPVVGQLRGHRRPLASGISIGTTSGSTTGTLGAFIRPQGGGPVGVLSNNHVLADQDRAPMGAPALQPGWDDGGREPTAVVGTLDRVVALQTDAVNTLDCATARLDSDLDWDPHLDPAPLTGVREPDLEEIVAKLGRTTGFSQGTVVAIETGPVTFAYAIGRLVFDGLVEVHGHGASRFADFGDSGSLVFSERDRHAVGLLFGVTRRGGRNGAGVSYVNPLPTVLQELKVELLLSRE